MDQALLDQLHAARFPLATVCPADSTTGAFYTLAADDSLFFVQGSYAGTVVERGLQLRFADRPIGAARWGESLVALGLLLFYCWLIYRFRKAVVTSFKASLSLEDTFVLFDHIPLEFHRFLSLSRLLALSSGALFVLLYPGFGVLGLVDGGGAVWWWGGVVCALYGSLGVQRLLLWLVSRFDAVPDRLLVLGNLNRLDWAVVSLFFPLAVVLVFGFGGLWPVAAGLFGLAVVVHWIRLFLYFKWAGFSILQWFLYLCTLEVLPFTLLWGLAQRIGVSY